MNAQDSLISELEEAIAHGNAERRAKTLRRITDLFVFGSGHFANDHVALFDGVFGHLITDIEMSARARARRSRASLRRFPMRRRPSSARWRSTTRSRWRARCLRSPSSSTMRLWSRMQGPRASSICWRSRGGSRSPKL
jgi:hypothetical protein